MKKPIEYTKEPMGKVKIIKDFLPSPENLIFKDEAEKSPVPLTHYEQKRH